MQTTEAENTYEEIVEMAEKTNKGDSKLDHKVILEFIKVMLKFWGEELNGREEGIKMSVKGKIDTGVYAQTR